MTQISASLVKELRDQTGAPMMDTKRALQEVWMAETKNDALAAFDVFVET